MVSTPKVGVYICHCGINIAATVDVKALAEYAASLPGVTVAREYTYMCSDPGQGLIKNDIAELGLNRVVVASAHHARAHLSCHDYEAGQPYV
jgi:heterodisulfide reductase subunit A